MTRKFRLFISGLLVALGLTNFAIAEPTRTARSYDNSLSKRAKALAVIVLSGHRVQRATVGLVVSFRSDDNYVPRDDSMLADRIYAAVKTELEREERYVISRIPVAPEQARQLAKALLERGIPRQLPELKALYTGCNCDAVLLVTDGPAEPKLMDTRITYGPSFIGRSGALSSGQVDKAHLRMGVMTQLVDPVSGERAALDLADDVPAYSDQFEQLWPGLDRPISDAHWQRMADYLGSLASTYRLVLYRTGLRPSCALVYYETSTLSQRLREEPPSTLPGSDPSKCQPPSQ